MQLILTELLYMVGVYMFLDMRQCGCKERNAGI